MIMPSYKSPDEKILDFWQPAVIVGCVVIFGGMVMGLKAWRVNNFAHSVATVTEVRDVKVRIGKHDWVTDLVFEPRYETITMGEIQFTRTHKGKSYDCTWWVELGSPSDKFKVGDRLDVVPATGTCQRVDIVGRIP